MFRPQLLHTLGCILSLGETTSAATEVTHTLLCEFQHFVYQLCVCGGGRETPMMCGGGEKQMLVMNDHVCMYVLSVYVQ